MLKKLIWNDVGQNKLMSAATVFFMTISAALLILTAMLMTNLLGAIDGLMEQAATPDFVQMHTGEMDETKIENFAKSRSDVKDLQLSLFLNLDNSRLTLGEHNMADSTQDNGLCVQNEHFDFLLGMDGELPEVSPGEVYVPVCYRSKYDLSIGDQMTFGDQTLVIAGFIRDAQMNAMMASSKRFLVSASDYEKLKEQGQEEYLIEFLLTDTADSSIFATAYTAGGLPSNGPTITRPLIRMMNALSDGMMIFVIFLVSVIVLMISILCIHFILSIQTERDRKEVGMLKVLGISRKDVRKLYFTKYILFSILGALLGLGLAAAAQNPLMKQLHELYGTGDHRVASAAIALLAALLTQGIILLSVRHSLRKTDKMSALQAFFQAQKKGRGLTQYILIGTVTAACTFLMLVPNNLYHTLSDSSFVTYMGIGNAELRIDIRQTEDINGITSKIVETLKDDTQVRNYAVLKTVSYQAASNDESAVNLTTEIGDHIAFPVNYLEGTAPVKENEIALSILNAEELGLSAGDTMKLLIDGEKTDFTVCGIYSDITNGGKTAKISGRNINAPIIWSVIYVSLDQSANSEQWMEQYRNMGIDVINISDYVRDTYAQTLNQLRLASFAGIIIAALVIAAVLVLFLRLMVERNRYTISLQKALGFTCAECERLYFWRGILPAVIGIAVGLLLGCLCGEGLCAMILRSFGAYGFRFVISPLEALLEIPLLSLMIAALAIRLGILDIKKIKAYECCTGKE